MENIFTLIGGNMKNQQKCQIHMRGHLLIGRRKGDISKSNTQNRMHCPSKCIMCTSVWRLNKKTCIKNKLCNIHLQIFKRFNYPIEVEHLENYSYFQEEVIVWHVVFVQKLAVWLSTVDSWYRPFELRNI